MAAGMRYSMRRRRRLRTEGEKKEKRRLVRLAAAARGKRTLTFFLAGLLRSLSLSL
jgi:hypothetical protein